jgi:predicted transcriptional regulator
MVRTPGRPHTSLNLMPISDIANALGTTERTVQRLLRSSLDKLEAAAQLDNFYTLVRSAQVARSQREAQEEEATADFHPVLQCTSFECNPSAWAAL